MLVNIHLPCGLYKLPHAYQYLHCFELFIVEKIIVHLVLHEFICIMNAMLKLQIKWFEVISSAWLDFKNFVVCYLPWCYQCNIYPFPKTKG